MEVKVRWFLSTLMVAFCAAAANADPQADFNTFSQLSPGISFQNNVEEQAEAAEQLLDRISGKWVRASMLQKDGFPQDDLIDGLCSKQPITIEKRGRLSADMRQAFKGGEVQGQLAWVGGSTFNSFFDEIGWLERLYGNPNTELFKYANGFQRSASASQFSLVEVGEDLLVVIVSAQTPEYWVRCR
jgi:hypothetical protein